MGRWRSAAALLALVACATFAAARNTNSAQLRRSLEESDGWIKVRVINKCSNPVSFKAVYTFFEDEDEGRPCPNKVPAPLDELGACSTDWATINTNESLLIEQLPDMLWWYSAHVEDMEPRYSVSQQTPESFLGHEADFYKECTDPDEDGCVWWGVPTLKERGNRLVLRCDDLGEPSEQEVSPVQVVNKCSEPINIKVAYSMTDEDTGAGCAIDKWLGKGDHLCVTEWQRLEAGEQRYMAATTNTFWTYGAHLVDDAKYDLAEKAFGAFQGINDTTACPETDAYGSGYVCEWWAPRYIDGSDVDPEEPLPITCDDYEPSK